MAAAGAEKIAVESAKITAAGPIYATVNGVQLCAVPGSANGEATAPEGKSSYVSQEAFTLPEDCEIVTTGDDDFEAIREHAIKALKWSCDQIVVAKDKDATSFTSYWTANNHKGAGANWVKDVNYLKSLGARQYLFTSGTLSRVLLRKAVMEKSAAKKVAAEKAAKEKAAAEKAAAAKAARAAEAAAHTKQGLVDYMITRVDDTRAVISEGGKCVTGKGAPATYSSDYDWTGVFDSPIQPGCGVQLLTIEVVRTRGSKSGTCGMISPSEKRLNLCLCGQGQSVGLSSGGYICVRGKWLDERVCGFKADDCLEMKVDTDAQFPQVEISVNGEHACRLGVDWGWCFAVSGAWGESAAFRVLLPPVAEAAGSAYTAAEDNPCNRLLLKLAQCMPFETVDEVPWDTEQPYFYFVPRAVVLACTSASLPPMQSLRAAGLLKRKTIEIAAAYRGEGLVKKVLFVSHRWEKPGAPDSTGAQLKAIQDHLKANPKLDFVWFDYSCMPQRESESIDGRSAKEKREFELMLRSIADLYLTSKVLIILDNTYMTRFWTLMEAWCSMMTVTSQGVRSASEAEQRYSIVCIHNADNEFGVPKLIKMLLTKTPNKVANMLASPDVQVTNAKDKETLLPVVRRIDDHVREVLLTA